MADPSADVIFALMAKLRMTTAVTDLVGTSIYDPPPQDDPSVKPPYISLGPTDIRRDDVTCEGGQSIFIQFDVWSWGAGIAKSSVLVRRISDAVAEALHDQVLTLPANRLSNIEHRKTEIMRDPGGIINHGVVQFWASVQRA